MIALSDPAWHPLLAGNPPAWASAWGEDEHGLFATIRVGAVGQVMRWIPAGTFWMGSPAGETGRFERETRHLVTLGQGFWLGATPCTQALWRVVMGTNPSRFVSPGRPVERVSWHDCHAFLATLNEQMPALRARLPTEAAWEHACRAGRETATWRGGLEILGVHNAPLLDAIAWYGGNSAVGFELENGVDTSDWSEKQQPGGRAGTHPVGKKLANPWGLYDMLGNVYEWCHDRYGTYPKGPRNDPTGPQEGSYRVVRGGSWGVTAQFVRAAYRYGVDPGDRDDCLGFRLALGPGRGAGAR